MLQHRNSVYKCSPVALEQIAALTSCGDVRLHKRQQCRPWIVHESDRLRGAYLEVVHSSEHRVALGLSWTHSVDNVPNHVQRLEWHLNNDNTSPCFLATAIEPV